MKKLLLILLCLPVFAYSQSKNEQLVVQYSMDYKLPLMKRLFKGMMPKSCTIYYSSNAYRIEAEMSILGMDGKVVDICNYTKMESISMMNISGKKKNQEMDTTMYQTNKIFIDSITKVNYFLDNKKILNTKCVKFSYENNNEKSIGFLSKEFSAIGAIIEGKDFGLPLEWETYDKEEKIKITFTAKSIKTEPLIESYYIIE